MAEQSLDRQTPAVPVPSRKTRPEASGPALPRHPRSTITYAPPMQRWIFRGGAEAARACGEAFGADLPHTACRASDSGGKAALWLGPDEWLLLCAADAAFDPSQITQAHSLVDVSHRQLGINISGEAAAQILNTHIGLDLDAAACPAGTCARTVFGKAEIVLWRKAEDAFHIEVWRSFAPYVTGLLGEACCCHTFLS